MSKNDRLFNINDAALQQHALTVSKLITKDMESFKAFDSTFPDDYPSLIEVCHANVQSIKTDMVVIDEMTERTQRVHDAWMPATGPSAALNTLFLRPTPTM
jgi:hypothetical protein